MPVHFRSLLAGRSRILSTIGLPSSSFLVKISAVISIRKLSSSPLFHSAKISRQLVGAQAKPVFSN